MRLFSENLHREKVISRRINQIFAVLGVAEGWILDDGTGQGIIAEGILNSWNIIGIDRSINAIKEASKQRNLHFMVAVGEFLPFKKGSINVVISQMVLEHVFNLQKYLEEIYWVLKFEGVTYLAAPNSMYPIEPHTKLPLITYLPHPLFQKIINVKMRRAFPLHYLRYSILKIFAGIGFKKTIELVPFFLKNAEEFYPTIPKVICRLILNLYGILRFFIPTWIWLLKK